MTTYRNELPQLDSEFFLTDGGLETTLIFHDGLDLPYFAAFYALDSEKGTEALLNYYRRYLDIAVRAGVGFILETPTWRANPGWGEEIGIDLNTLEAINRRSVEVVNELRDEYARSGVPIVVSGNVGPAADGYTQGDAMSLEEAIGLHELQARVFADSGVDMVSAITMTYPEEAAGVVLASQRAELPVVISFTTETDGCLPNGQSVGSAIEWVDEETGGGPAYYMINCAHTDHFDHALNADERWVERVRGIRGNASRMSHEELDECDTLHDGDPIEFGLTYRQMKDRLPGLTVFGGCCGTDHRHIEQTARYLGAG